MAQLVSVLGRDPKQLTTVTHPEPELALKESDRPLHISLNSLAPLLQFKALFRGNRDCLPQAGGKL